jgi:hypothetical protein
MTHKCLAKVSSEHGITTSKFLVQAVHPSLPKEQGSITIWKSFFHVKPNMLTVNLPVISHLPIPIASSEIILNSKKASWNRQLRGYQLDFGGRVITTSPKNFQLVECQSQLVLQFGRIENKAFILDFQAPFTPIQAFATALASLA